MWLWLGSEQQPRGDWRGLGLGYFPRQTALPSLYIPWGVQVYHGTLGKLWREGLGSTVAAATPFTGR